MAVFSKEERTLMFLLERWLKGQKAVTDCTQFLCELDWDCFYSLTVKHKLFFPVWEMLKPIFSYQVLHKWQVTYSYFTRQINQNMSICDHAMKEIAEANEYVSIAKGFVSSVMIYNSPYMRQPGDIDLHVAKNKRMAVCEVLRKKGYRLAIEQGLDNSISVDIPRYYSEIEEILFLPSTDVRSETLLEVKYDDPGAYLFCDIIESANKCKATLSIGDIAFSVFDSVTAAYYLIMNAYKNQFDIWSQIHQKFLRDFFDIAAWAMNHPDFEYGRLKEMAIEYHSFDLVALMLSLSFDFFNLEYPEYIAKYFPHQMTESSRYLFAVFRETDRLKELYAFEVSHIPQANFRQLSCEEKIHLKHHTLIPVHNCEITIEAQQKENNYICFFVSGFVPHIQHKINLVIWEPNLIDNLHNRQEINVFYIDGQIVNQTTMLAGVTSFTNSADKVEIMVPITPTSISESHMLYELHLYWECKPMGWKRWLHIGGAHNPFGLTLC